MEGRWEGGIYCPPEDQRGAYIRGRMRERYPRIEDEFAIMAYGTEEEKTEHAAWRAEVKRDADRRFPKEERRAAGQGDNDGAGEEELYADQV